jgi:large subunit ribosomal protein L19
MATAIQSPVKIAERKALDIRSGDNVRVWQKIVEKGKTRLQAFEGLVIAVKHGKEAGATFTVRRVASGVGVEKIFPIYSPMIDSIETLKRSKVRRAKLYHVRDKAAKVIRRQMRNIRALPDNVYVDEETLEVKEPVLEDAPKDEVVEVKE